MARLGTQNLQLRLKVNLQPEMAELAGMNDLGEVDNMSIGLEVCCGDGHVGLGIEKLRVIRGRGREAGRQAGQENVGISGCRLAPHRSYRF